MSQPEPKDRKPGRPEANRTWDYWHRTDMCHSVTLYVPSKLSNGQLIAADRENLIKAAMNFLLREMHGATQIQGVGYYLGDEVNGERELHEEEVTLCKSLCTTQTFVEQRANLRRLANSLAIEFEQEAFAVEIDGEMHFFSPTPAYKKRYKEMVESGEMDGVSGYHKYIDARLD